VTAPAEPRPERRRAERGDPDRRSAERQPRESRHRARETALQMLYQWEVGKLEIADVFANFRAEEPDEGGALPEEHVVALPEDLRAFAASLAAGVAGRVGELDPVIAEAAENWRLERMNVLDRLILRLALYEFLHQPETPGAVIINEALELARTFSGDESVKFVNGVLDAVRKTLHRE
jgi:N utilization substance protein B